MGFALLPKLPQPFVLERHRAEANPPTWLLRTLPQRWMVLLLPQLEKQPERALAAFVEVALVGVTGVEQDGQAVQFTPAGRRQVFGEWVEGGALGDFIDALPLDVMVELGSEVVKRNQLDKANQGN
jgi:hypothetical protein